jgi:hypothetical protein
MALDKSFCRWPAQAGPLVAVGAVKSLKRSENPFGVRRINADTIVANTEDPFPSVQSSRNMDYWGTLFMAILQAVADEVPAIRSNRSAPTSSA